MKIMIVDDEVIIREWLQAAIEKQADWELVGCAENGRQALSMIGEAHPDVIFTDIKMPIMDGITLLQEVKKYDPNISVVLLTAFSEFHLAREALKIGAEDYILKTEVSNAELSRLLQQLKSKIDGRRIGTASAGETEEESTYRYARIRDILKEKKVLSDSDWEALKDCNVRWRDDGLFAIAFWKQDVKKQAVFPKNPQVCHVILLEQDEDTYVLIGNLAHELSEQEKIQVLYSYAYSMTKENDCMVGISRIHFRKTQVNYAIGEAIHSLSIGFYEGKKRLYEPVYAGEALYQKWEQWKEQCSGFYREFCKARYGEKASALNGLSDICVKERIYQVGCVKDLIAKILNDSIFQEKKVAGESISMLEHVKRQIQEEKSFKNCVELLREFVTMQLRESAIADKEFSRSVTIAVDYIRMNYAKPISLEEISEVVNLNPEYLSRLFKGETGCTYSTFLVETRLRQAACLLEETNEKVHKIAEQVGYPNVSYFSTVFKKHFQCNPFEYRRSCKSDS